MGNCCRICRIYAFRSGDICAFAKTVNRNILNDTEVLNIGNVAFRIIGASFVPAALSLTFPILFQAIGKGKESIFITVLRQVVLLVPLAWVFSFAGLNYVWLTFPVTEIITCSVSMIFIKKFFIKMRDF